MVYLYNPCIYMYVKIWYIYTHYIETWFDQTSDIE